MIEKEEQVIAELNGAQGSPVDIGGYFKPAEDKTSKAMRPSQTLNGILEMVVASV